MRKLIKILIVIHVIAIASFGLINSSGAVDSIIAVVNDEIITLKDLKDYVRSVYVQMVTEGVPEDTIKQAMNDLQVNGVYKLIEDKLMLSEANAVGIEVRPKLIDDRIAQVKKRYPTEEAFLESLIKSGGTISDLRNKIIEQYKIKFIIDHEVRSKIFVNPQEVTDYYELNKDQFLRKERASLDSIFIDFKNDKAAARQKANEAYQLIQGGGDFQETAKKYSDSPSIGIMERGQLLPAIENVIFSLNEGQVSAPTEIETGIYIFKLNSKIQAQMASLKEVKEDVYNIVFQNKFKSRLETWISKLKKRAYVEIK